MSWIVIACLLHIKGIYIDIRINFMAVITPIKIRNAVILVKIPYTGPSCIPFIHCLAFDDFSYKCCIFGVSEGHDYHSHNAISVFLVCIPSSSATFGSKKYSPFLLR